MEDQISNVHNAHHCCQFMYKGWQISLTTVPPPEIPEDLPELVASFIWSKTRQGYEFWEEVLEKTEGL